MATPSSARRPAPGDLIAYHYLWSHEAAAGRDDAAKERPCVVVLAVGEGEHPNVVVAPITSQEPARDNAILLDRGIVGLNRRSWIIPWDLNAFRWPGPDLGQAAAPVGAHWRLGSLHPRLRRLLADRIAALLKTRTAKVVRRSE